MSQYNTETLIALFITVFLGGFWKVVQRLRSRFGDGRFRVAGLRKMDGQL